MTDESSRNSQHSGEDDTASTPPVSPRDRGGWATVALYLFALFAVAVAVWQGLEAGP